jgi:hypothetical protein
MLYCLSICNSQCTPLPNNSQDIRRMFLVSIKAFFTLCIRPHAPLQPTLALILCAKAPELLQMFRCVGLRFPPPNKNPARRPASYKKEQDAKQIDAARFTAERASLAHSKPRNSSIRVCPVAGASGAPAPTRVFDLHLDFAVRYRVTVQGCASLQRALL